MDDLKKNAAVVSFRLDGHKSTTNSFFKKEGWRPAVFSNLPEVEIGPFMSPCSIHDMTFIHFFGKYISY